MNAKNQLEQHIRNHINGFEQGYFITVDTQYTTATHNFDYDFLTEFAEATRDIMRKLNVYTFGRNYRRYEMMKKQGMPITTDYKLAEVTAYEIGIEGRLHLHSMLLHKGGSDRTADEVRNQLEKICSHHPCTRLKGKNALHVVPYNPDLDDEWIAYFLKSHDFFRNRYGFLNIDCM